MPQSRLIKIKTTGLPTEHVCATWTSIPKEIIDNYGEVTLAVDIMTISKIPFMVNTSRNIHFGTAQLIRNNSKDMIMTSISQVVWTYQARGFQVCNILADSAFKCIRDSLSEMGIALNVSSRNEHEPEIEQYIRKVKERVRSIANSLPFR